MGLALDLQAGFVTGPGSTITAATNASGDTFVVRSAQAGSSVYLDQLIRAGATAGLVRVRSPLLHDNVQGVRFACPSGTTPNLLKGFAQQTLQPQDTLTVEETGGTTTEVDTVCVGTYYTDLGGASARLVMPSDIAPSLQYLIGYEISVTSSATAGQWLDTVINATEDILRASTDYAVLGYICDSAVAAVAIKGPDTSNFRVGGPGMASIIDTRQYFADMSTLTGRPHIPVLNSSNKGSTYVSVLAPTASVPVNITLILAEVTI
jgi:hypothetical protein